MKCDIFDIDKRTGFQAAKPVKAVKAAKAFVVILVIPCLFISCTRCKLQLPGMTADEISVLTYNVQNLFDDVDNDTEYYEYDPGEEEWTTTHFHTKCMHVAEVIATSVQHGPDIVALQEIENENTLDTLNNDYLKGKRYRYTAFVPAPDSAVNVALLSRFPITEIRAHQIYVDEPRKSRHILECRITVGENEFVLFNNHWKSKSGGARETEPLRIEAAGVVRRRVAEISAEAPKTDIIVVGDFNENVDEYTQVAAAYQTALLPSDGEAPDHYLNKSLLVSFNKEEMRAFSGSRGTDVLNEGVVLYTCWADEEHPGSYVYRGKWEAIDGVLVSSALFDSEGLTYQDFEVVDRGFLLGENGFPRGWDREKKEGYSDHLPLLVRFSVEKEL